MPGGKFEDAVNALVAQFGRKKRSTFTRWSHMTQTLPEAIRHKLDTHADLPQTDTARCFGVTEAGRCDQQPEIGDRRAPGLTEKEEEILQKESQPKQQQKEVQEVQAPQLILLQQLIPEFRYQLELYRALEIQGEEPRGERSLNGEGGHQEIQEALRPPDSCSQTSRGLDGQLHHAIRQKLMRGGIVKTSQLRDVEMTEFITTGAAGLKEVRDRREAMTILQAMDFINQKELEKAMDVLAMRVTALLEAKSQGGTWEKAAKKELIPEEGASIAPAGLTGMV